MRAHRQDDDHRGEKVIAYLLGEMDPGTRIRFEQEIAADDDLLDEVETLGRVVAKLDALPDESWEPPSPRPRWRLPWRRSSPR